MIKRASVALLLCLSVPAALAAHDFWLAITTWHATPGAKVTVSANVGDRFPVPTTFTAPERVASLALIGPKGRAELTEFRREQSSLATDVQLPHEAATYLVVMVIRLRFIEIPSKDFASYLTHEGLERIIAERDRLGEASRPGRERYSRYAKLLVRADDGPSDHVTRPVGLAAELVARNVPHLDRAAESAGATRQAAR